MLVRPGEDRKKAGSSNTVKLHKHGIIKEERNIRNFKKQLRRQKI